MDINLSSSTPARGAESLVRDLVFERTGLMFDDGKLDIFVGKLAPLMKERGFGSYLDYFYLLKYDPTANDAWNEVINALTVQETYFWREMDQIHALAENLLPEIIAKDPYRRVRIWSAACATGEEALTIAMRLNEDGWFQRAEIEILASDASTDALKRAVSGVFGERSFRALPAHLKSKYFTPEGKNWKVSNVLHDRIKWSCVNLLEEAAVAEMSGVSVIFCRNVFIYFSTESIRRVVDAFAKGIRVPGFLLVGAAESLLKVTDFFELEEINNGFAYTKRK